MKSIDVDILSIVEKSIRNNSLKNEVISTIDKCQKVDLSKIKNKDMDRQKLNCLTSVCFMLE